MKKLKRAKNGIEGTMSGLTDVGFNYNSAWGGAWRNGGFLPILQNGDTLVKSKQLGVIEKKLKDFNFKAPYTGSFSGIVKKPNCPGGVGCAEQSVDITAQITGAPRETLSPFDAGYRNEIFRREGAKEIWYPEAHRNWDPTSFNTKKLQPVPKELYNTLQIGDFVGLTVPSTDGLSYSYKNSKAAKSRGLTSKDLDAARHWGVVVGFDKNGTPLVRHGWAKHQGSKTVPNMGEFKVDPIDKITIGKTNWHPVSIQRPQVFTGDNAIVTRKPVSVDAKSIAKGKQNTTSSEKFMLDYTSEEQLLNELPVAGHFSGAATRLSAKKKMVEMFNDKKLDDELKYKLGLTQKELNNLKPLFYGLVGQETTFEDVDSLGRSLKELFGSSVGPAQIKLSSLTDDEKRVIGVKSEDDLYDLNNAYKAGMLLLNNARKQMNRQVEMGTHPELKDKDEYWRSLYFYNAPHRAMNTAEEWENRPRNQYRGLFTPPRPKEKVDELRLDEGSYPDKVRRKAADLQVFTDEGEHNPQMLEEVFIPAVKTSNNSKFIPKKMDGGSIPGLTGFLYSRSTGAAPSEGKYAKKTMPSAQNGQEMKFYQEGLDFKPKTISKNGGWLDKYQDDVVKDDEGYWNPENHGKVVEINSNNITMKGVDQPLIGVSDTGDVQYMEPGEDYVFDGTKVREYPVAAQGVSVNKADEYPLKKLDDLLNFTNYNKKAKNGGWLDKYC